LKGLPEAIQLAMNGLTPHAIALLTCTGAAVWMAIAGVHKNALEWRRRRRNCPSCGRMIDGRVCAKCTQPI
jgi:hypothetical protein